MSTKGTQPGGELSDVMKDALRKLARLSPAETRELGQLLTPGVSTDSGIVARMQNVAIQTSVARTLVMLSGGLDSVAMLYLLLKQEQGLPLHVHHVHIQGWESDTKPLAEQRAVHQVTDYLWNQGFRFEYSESHSQFQHNAFDQAIYYFQGACLAASMSRVTRVAIGRVKEDATLMESMQFRVHPTQSAMALFNNIIENWPLADRQVDFVFPLVEYDKAQVVKSLPDELLDLVCSCRQPIILENGDWERCGKCRKCQEYRQLRI